MQNIDFLPTILSRFDMIFIVKDEHDVAKDTVCVVHMYIRMCVYMHVHDCTVYYMYGSYKHRGCVSMRHEVNIGTTWPSQVVCCNSSPSS